MQETLTLQEAETLAARAFAAAGASQAQAGATAAALVLSEASGQAGHGMVRVPVYAEGVAAGKIAGAAAPSARRLAPGLVQVDAGGGFAFPAWRLAAAELPALAAECGLAAATVIHSNHLGVAGLQAEALAERGLVALVFGNATACMAPWGGSRPVFGTNPIAFAAPMPGGPPLVIDMATSAVTKGRILSMKAAGATEVPEGWAVDETGAPVTEIEAAAHAMVAPMGGPKGAALALMVEVLSACVAGGALSARASSLLDAEGPPPDIAATAIAIDPGAASGGLYAERMTGLMEAFAASEGARLPGARRLEARAAAARDGLRLPAALIARIRAIADGALGGAG